MFGYFQIRITGFILYSLPLTWSIYGLGCRIYFRAQKISKLIS